MKTTVSIGIPVYNEEKNIGKLLERLLKEKFKFNLNKIIVVASGCTDRTENIVRSFKQKNRRIRIISEKIRKGKSSAINLILKNASGKIIVFIDADNLLKSRSINKVVEKFSDKEVGATSGRQIPLESKKKLFGYISHFVWKLHHRYCSTRPKISGELCAIRNGIIKNIPNNIINDDGYLTAIMRKGGWKILYVPEALVYLKEKNSFLKHIKRRRRIARGYQQLKELKLDVSIPYKTMFKLTAKEICREPQNILKIFFAVGLEVIIIILAYYDTFRGYTPYCWKK